jgi:putative transposase
MEGLREEEKGVQPPKEIPLKRYRSFTYPQYGNGTHLHHHKLYLSHLGEFHIRDSRKVRGKPKSVTIKWMHGRPWAIIAGELLARDVYGSVSKTDPREDVGFDCGLEHLLDDSEKNTYDPPKPFDQYKKKLKSQQKKLSWQFEARKKPFVKAKESGLFQSKLSEFPLANRLKKQIKVVVKTHTKIERIQDDGHKKHTRIMGERYRKVAVEEHGLLFMFGNRKLSKSDVADQNLRHRKKLPCELETVSEKGITS